MVAGRIVTCQDGDVKFAFVSGNLALDFVGTRKWRRSEPEEGLPDAAALDYWLRQSPAGPAVPPLSADDFERAIALREAIYSAVASTIEGAAADDADVRLINAIAAEPPAVPAFSAGGRFITATPSQALSTIARAGIDSLVAPNVGLVRECGRDECTRLYVDRSRGARRAWCGMDECGNRMKAAAYRARRRGHRLAGDAG